MYKPEFTATYGSGTSKLTVNQTFTLFVFAAPTYYSAASATGRVGTALNFTVKAHGFPLPTFTKTGQLPKGVKFTSKSNGTAVLSGTPSSGTGGTYAITITAHNSDGTSVQHFKLTVLPLHIVSHVLPAGKRGTPYKAQLTAQGGASPYVWTVVTKPPAGLTLSRTGKLSGTPKATDAAKTYSFSVKVTDHARKTASATLTLKLT